MPEFAVVHRITHEMNNPPHKVKSRLRNKEADSRFHMIGQVRIHLNGCANEEGKRPTISLHKCSEGELFQNMGAPLKAGDKGLRPECTVCVPDYPQQGPDSNTGVNDMNTTSTTSTPGAYINDLNISGRLMPVVQRGKEIAFAIGLYVFRICLSLEGHGFWLPTEMYQDILKAGTVRSTGHTMYRIPQQHWRGPPGVLGRIRIIFSFECEKYTWIFADHTAAMTIHVKACRAAASVEDMAVGTKLWSRLWSKSHGPSLVDEREEAEKVLENWRLASVKTLLDKSIFLAVKNTQSVFNGYGAQETTDMLFQALIMPVMPTYAVCSYRPTWERFKKAVFEYQEERVRIMEAKTVQTKLTYISGDDPFRFLTGAHQHFAGHVTVFRRAWVKVSKHQLEEAKQLGLFNWHGSMLNTGRAVVEKNQMEAYNAFQARRGLPHYQRKAGTAQEDRNGFVLVRNRELTVRNAWKGVKTVKSYSPFCARFHASWWSSDQAPQFVKKDLLQLHNVTTVGPYSFRVFVSANWTISTVQKPPSAKGLKINKKALIGRRRVTGFIRPRTMEISKR
ncbi:hypothetical protein CVT24_009465, partial [Panaeolus cyanescens]